MMVQERLLEVLLGNPAIATPAPIQAPPPLATSTNEGDSDYVGSPMPNAVASKECVDLRDMEIDGAEDSDSSDVTLERQVAGGLRTMSVATADDGGSVRFGAVQVVASMVDRALKVTPPHRRVECHTFTMLGGANKHRFDAGVVSYSLILAFYECKLSNEAHILTGTGGRLGLRPKWHIPIASYAARFSIVVA